MANSKIKKNIKINTNKVVVSTKSRPSTPKPHKNKLNQNKTKRHRRRRNMRSRSHKATPYSATINEPELLVDAPEVLEEQGVIEIKDAAHFPSEIPSYVPDGPNAGFILQYLDPNDEHLATHMYKVPDGALSMSGLLQYRFFDTVFPPFTNRSEVNLEGRNYSMLVLVLPLFRSLGCVLVHRTGQEFGPAVMQSFIRAILQLPDDPDLYYFPEWLTTDLYDEEDGEPLLYFTFLATPALRALQPPNDLGISASISQYRICGQGITLGENAPSLFNQGTTEAAQFNLNISTPTALDTNGGLPFLYLNFSVARVNGVATFTATSNNPTVFPPYLLNTAFPSQTRTSDHTFIAESGTTIVSVGDEYRIELRNNAVILQNVTDSSLFLTLGPFGPSNHTAYFQSRIYYDRIENDPIIPVTNTNIHQIALPPTTQAALAQADILSKESMFKDRNGVYMPIRTWQPVFSLQEAANFGRMYFANRSTTATDIYGTNGGLLDSSDLNFGIGVINCQAVPYAAAPLIKIYRAVEIVPGEDSVYAPIITGCPPACQEAIDIAHAATATEPHAYSGDDNGIGLLFGKLVTKLPKVIKGIKTAVDVGRTASREAKRIRSEWKET